MSAATSLCVVKNVSGGLPTRLAGTRRSTEGTDNSQGVRSLGANLYTRSCSRDLRGCVETSAHTSPSDAMVSPRITYTIFTATALAVTKLACMVGWGNGGARSLMSGGNTV